MRRIAIIMILFTGLLLCSCQSINNETDPLVGEWLIYSTEAWKKVDGQIEDMSDSRFDWKVSLTLAEDGESYVATFYYKVKGTSSWLVNQVYKWTFIDNKVYEDGVMMYDVLSLTESEMILEFHSFKTYYDAYNAYFEREVTEEIYSKQVYRKQKTI